MMRAPIQWRLLLLLLLLVLLLHALWSEQQLRSVNVGDYAGCVLVVGFG